MAIQSTLRSTIPFLMAIPALRAQSSTDKAILPALPSTTVPSSSVTTATTYNPATLAPNLVLNGDLENYSGGTCDNNLTNASFTAMMANATGFGTSEELDVYTNPACYGIDTISGQRKVAMHSNVGGLQDAFSFDLSSPVVAGNSYLVSFWAHSASDLSVGLGKVDIGLSSSASDPGTLVFSGSSTVLDIWEQFSTTFIAPVDATYLTVSSEWDDGVTNSWSHVDNFRLELSLGTNYCTTNANSTGFPADIFASGSASSAAGDLTLTSSPVPNQNGIFFHGATTSNIPFGNGTLCTTGDLRRGSVVFATGNTVSYTYDNSSSRRDLSAYIGTSRNFQHWFRDPMGGGSSFNTSNAIAISILP